MNTRMFPHRLVELGQFATAHLLRSITGGFSYLHSYAQEGEDILLLRLLGERPHGFYVDVGAHHPKRFSNTYLFYQMGWRGINIDATPGSMQKFRWLRPRDMNIETAVASEPGTKTFYIFNEPALNTFDPRLARLNTVGSFCVIAEQPIITRRLEDILRESLPTRQQIDFLSIDVEGSDLDVLQSNNWDLFRATFVLVESTGADLDQMAADPAYRFLTQQEYHLCAKTLNTLFFQDRRSL